MAGQQFEYAFDDIGNRRTAASGGDQWGANLRFQNYTPNALNQYSQRTVPGALDVQGSATNTATVTVNNQPTYRKDDYFRAELSVDNSAGPLWQGITNVAVLPQGTNADIVTNFTGNVLVPPATQTFSHDADGNLTNDGVWAYTWDAENRLLSMTSLSAVPAAGRQVLQFGYDFQGRRISKVVSNWTGTAWSLTLERKFLYEGWNLIAEMNGGNGTMRQYLWGTDLSGSRQGAGGVGGLVKVFDVVANVHYFPAYDGNGNVAALIRADTGTVEAEYEYGPFGELLRALGTAAAGNPFRFSTKYQDDETGMLYYGYRYYLPSVGRWVSRDPIGERGGENLAALLANNPINKTDVLGLRDDAKDDVTNKPGERCTLRLTYDFVPQSEVAKSMQPVGTVYVKKSDDITSDIKKKVPIYDRDGECCRGRCISSISISSHGAGRGRINFGDTMFDQGSQQYLALEGEVPKIIKDLREDYARARDFLESLKARMCKKSEITFVTCGAGGGPEGEQLRGQLATLFGPDTDVTVYSGTCSFILGRPVSTRFLIRE